MIILKKQFLNIFMSIVQWGANMMNNQDTDITRNIKIVEFLKSEILTTVATLFQILLKGAKAGQDALIDTLANLILVTYLLGKRLGIGFSVIDTKIMEKIKIGLLEEHQAEKWYGDLSSLSDYYMNHKR